MFEDYGWVAGSHVCGAAVTKFQVMSVKDVSVFVVSREVLIY